MHCSSWQRNREGLTNQFFLCRYHCYIREILKAQLKGQFYTKKMFRVAILVHNFYKTP